MAMSQLLSTQIKQISQELELMAESYHTLGPLVLNNNTALYYLLSDKGRGVFCVLADISAYR